MKGPIQSLQVSYLLHATEDPDRIGSAVASLLGPVGEPKREVMEGHFGNSITRVTHHLTGEEARGAFSALVSKMSPGLKHVLRGELVDHLDEHFALYLRVDKQQLIAGKLELTEGDPVRVRVKPRLYTARGGAVALFTELLS